MSDAKIHVARDPHPASPAVQAKAAEMAAIAQLQTARLKKRRDFRLSGRAMHASCSGDGCAECEGRGFTTLLGEQFND